MQLQHPSQHPTQFSRQLNAQYLRHLLQFSHALPVSPHLQSMQRGAQRVQQHAQQQRLASPHASTACQQSTQQAVLQAVCEKQQHWQHFLRNYIGEISQICRRITHNSIYKRVTVSSLIVLISDMFVFNYSHIYDIIIIIMNRLLSLKNALISSQEESIDSHDLMVALFGPHYPQRQAGFEVIRRQFAFISPHDSLYDVRKKTLFNNFIAKKGYSRSIAQVRQDPNHLSLYGQAFPLYDMGMAVRGGVHSQLYAKAILLLGTDKHEELVERAGDYKDYGCFALTELTHGSNVRGILTEAHYDHKNKQFIIHTPSEEGIKFWIGGAAQTANKAAVWAQLYIGQKCHGVHAYVVPIRDQQTHKLLPGVLIGDCGHKNGNNGIDNGFIKFDRVRIPKEYQLDRISGVDQNGNFRSMIKNDQKRFGLQLSALSGGRYQIASTSIALALVALTIAIRYCNERRQFKGPKDKEEKLLISYPLMKRRLMPLLAQTLVYTTASMHNLSLWDAEQKNLQQLKVENVQNLHAIASVMKSKTSWFTNQCIKECRQAMGGHGYSAYSKLGGLYNDNDVNLTWEGDNHVLIQQTTKQVLEQAQKVMQKGKPTEDPLLQFLSNPPDDLPPLTRENMLSFDQTLNFWRFKLMRKIEGTGMRMFELKQKGLSMMQIWNNAQVYLGRQVALIYGDISVLTIMVNTISKCEKELTKHILKVATQLWILSIYRADQYVQIQHHPLIERIMSELSESLEKRSLQILKIVSVGDDVIGSPFADPNGRGMDKYLAMVMSGPENVRPEAFDALLGR